MRKFYLGKIARQAIREEAALAYPTECVGLVAGVDNVMARAVHPLTNTLHSPLRYEVDPREQLYAYRTIEGYGMEVIGIYHSHTRSDAVASEQDRRWATPGLVYVIYGVGGDEFYAFEVDEHGTLFDVELTYDRG